MKKLRNSKRLKVVAVFMVINMVTEILAPSMAWALTSGPAQPEFSSFEPVTTTNMVNPFTGDFTYNLPVLNVPGPNGGGYAVSLSYHSGVTPEEEASWVGLGWTLNPGAINRNKRGFADDVFGEEITTHHKSKPSHTAVFTPKLGLETYSMDELEKVPAPDGQFSASISKSVRYNNYKGYASDLSFTMAALNGVAGISFTQPSDGDFGITPSVNPVSLIGLKSSLAKKEGIKEGDRGVQKKSDFKKKKKEMSPEGAAMRAGSIMSSTASQYGMSAITGVSMQTDGSETTGSTWAMDYTGQTNVTGAHVGMDLGGAVRYSYIHNKEDDHTTKAYGYLYMSEGNNRDDLLTDFTIEKESNFNNRDNYLPAPFSSKDVFAVSGEGIGGSFQVFHHSIGHANRTKIKSSSTTFTPSVDMSGGVNSGVGFGVEFGGYSTEFGPWEVPGSNLFQFSSADSAFMRFNGDLSGSIQYSYPNKLMGKVGKHIPSDILPNLLYGKKRASTYVGYRTVEEVLDTLRNKFTNESVHFKAFDKSVPGLKSFNDYRFEGNFAKTIAEISTVNKEGQRMNYSLPVYNDNSKTMSYSAEGIRPFGWEETGSKYVVLRDIFNDKQIKTINGTESFHKYASTYLLTSITNSDYIDRTFDGPTADDFGGWTKFNYRRASGQYHWRSPYAGLRYAQNAKIDPQDDMGTLVSADKEIYFLKSIETKTHVAYFVTNLTDTTISIVGGGSVDLVGSQDPRKDAVSAADDYTAAKDINAVGNVEKEMLERIVLFAKNANGELTTGRPIQTTYFDYSGENGDKYELCKGTFNSKDRDGKLTLKRVWFEHEGIKNTKIRPYEFKYEYKDYEGKLPAKYNDIANHNQYLDGEDKGKQNPDYFYNISDPWGNYRGDGMSRDFEEKPWIDQSNIPDRKSVPNEDFDPAAWHLKQIILPSGGEIHVQYEQDDYAYVQDKKAMSLISIKDIKFGNAIAHESISDTKYELNMDEFDLSSNSSFTLDDYKEILEDEIVDKHVYFKFLYKLIKDASDLQHSVSLGDCRSDFVSGWMKVTGVEVDHGKIYLKTPSDPKNRPLELCKDIVKKNYKGLAYTKDCYSAVKQYMDKDKALDVMEVYNHLSALSGNLTPGDKWELCKEQDYAHSYIRVPVPFAKRGGGVRVKRLLSYTDGIEAGDEAIYGTEYTYKLLGGLSSGVATSDPYREENPMISMLRMRDPKNTIQKIMAGRDKEQFEGPYGETVFPMPSVGYSSVVISNIHKGKTAPGFHVETFHTAKEHPIVFIQNNADIPDVVKERTGPTPLYQSNKNWAKGYQEYVIIKNDMHGKPKKKETFRGAFNSLLSLSSHNRTAATTFKYFAYNAKVPILAENGSIVYDYLGREEDVIMDGRYGRDKGDPLQIQNDPSFTSPAVVMYSLLNYTTDILNEYKRHVTTKVVSYSSLPWYVETMQNGVTSKVENLAFDINTGKAVVTATTDGFDNVSISSASHNGRYLSYDIPAAHVYPHLGQKVQNEGFVLSVEDETLDAPIKLLMDCIGDHSESWLGSDNTCQVNVAFINLQSQGAKVEGKGAEIYRSVKDPNEAIKDGANRSIFINALDKGQLIEGDLIELSSVNENGNRLKALYYINEIDLHNRHRIYLNPVSFVANSAGEDPAAFTRLEVISSGYTNELNASAGSVTTYGKDLVDNVYVKTPNTVKGQEEGDDPVMMNHYGAGTAMSTEFYNVVASATVEYSDDWYNYQLTNAYEGVTYSCLKANTFETGARGKWRPKSSYAYKDDLVNDPKISGQGYIQSLIPFIFRKPNVEVYDYSIFYGNPAPDRSEVPDYMSSHEGSSTGEIVNLTVQDSTKWIKTNTITMYSPNGEVLEEENIMHVPSSARFAYGDNVPVMVAQNAPYRAILFEGFDDRTDDYVTTNKAHSGNKSGVLETNQEMDLGIIEAVSNISGTNSMKLKFWLHQNSQVSDLEVTLKNIVGGSNVELNAGDLTQVAKVGEWQLMEMDNILLPSSNNYRGGNSKQSRGPGDEFQLSMKNTGASLMFIDDVRLQPSESQVTAYVYDSDNLRLLASFDDQHFGLFYQYNAEGKLIRKLIETERGVKTVTETQYHTPEKDR